MVQSCAFFGGGRAGGFAYLDQQGPRRVRAGEVDDLGKRRVQSGRRRLVDHRIQIALNGPRLQLGTPAPGNKHTLVPRFAVWDNAPRAASPRCLAGSTSAGRPPRPWRTGWRTRTACPAARRLAASWRSRRPGGCGSGRRRSAGSGRRAASPSARTGAAPRPAGPAMTGCARCRARQTTQAARPRPDTTTENHRSKQPRPHTK